MPPPISEHKLEEHRTALTNEIMKNYHDAAKQVCIDQKVEFIDSWNIFGGMIDQNNDYHVEDGIHMNDHGYEVLTDKLNKLIRNT